MKTFYHVVNDFGSLNLFLESSEIRANVGQAKSILIQVFSSQTDERYIESISAAIEDKLPTAVIAGVTTVGEITEGRLLIGTTVLSISFFDTAVINPIALTCAPGDEYVTGQRLMQAVSETGADVAGVLMFATTHSLNMSTVFKGMSRKGARFPVFGGGAGVYDHDQCENSAGGIV